MKILAIDNDARALEELQACLCAAAPRDEVLPFTDSMLAVKYLVNHPGEVALVFAALVMKRMDSILLTEQILRLSPFIRVVIVGNTDPHELWPLLWQRGAARYLRRPVTEGAVRDALSALAPEETAPSMANGTEGVV